VAKDGTVYLADNSFGLRDYRNSPDKQRPDGIYRIKDGKTQLLMDDKALGGIPNGIALSPDEKYLYLNSGFTLIRRHALLADGTLGAGEDFTSGVGIGDGMKTDLAGNLWSTSGGGPGIVRITSPAGKLLGTINLPIYGGEPKRQICATNVTFGGNDGKSLFIAACDALYEIRMKVKG
jgi:gluconolactonase